MLINTRMNCIDAASGIGRYRGRPVHRLREYMSYRFETACSKANLYDVYSLNLCTEQPFTESDDTRSCINTIQPPDDEHIMLETRRGL